MMDEIVSQISITGLFAIVVACITIPSIIRRIVETAWPSVVSLKKDGHEVFPNGMSRWWNKVILYALPVLVGTLLGLVKSEFLFGAHITTRAGRMFYGMQLGFLSGFLFKILCQLILIKTGVKVPVPVPDTLTDGNSVPPKADAAPDTQPTGTSPEDKSGPAS